MSHVLNCNSREKPQDTEWNELFDKKKPVLLNYAQCKLNTKEYYPAIEYCTEILKQDPGKQAMGLGKLKTN